MYVRLLDVYYILLLGLVALDLISFLTKHALNSANTVLRHVITFYHDSLSGVRL